jgi:hypothetical protein
MPTQGWVQGFTRQTASGTLFNTYTTAKTVINQQSLFGVPGNALVPGDSLTITAMGAISNIATTPGTVTFQIMMGTVVAWTSGAIQLNATAHTTLPFRLQVELTVQLINTTVGGAVAKFMGFGILTGVMFTKTAAQTDGANSETVIMVPVTAPAQGTAFDSTVANNVDFWVGFSISNAGNGVQIHQYRVDSNN